MPKYEKHCSTCGTTKNDFLGEQLFCNKCGTELHNAELDIDRRYLARDLIQWALYNRDFDENTFEEMRMIDLEMHQIMDIRVTRIEFCKDVEPMLNDETGVLEGGRYRTTHIIVENMKLRNKPYGVRSNDIILHYIIYGDKDTVDDLMSTIEYTIASTKRSPGQTLHALDTFELRDSNRPELSVSVVYERGEYYR